MDMSPEDAPNWSGARTLADLGELTALFLEGQIQQTPTHGGPPDPETTPLIPVLAACNRAGFITRMSQPGILPDRRGSAKRADVSGYAGSETFGRLMTVVAGADLIVTAARAFAGGGRDCGPFFPITLDHGRECTWDGGAEPREAVEAYYGQVCRAGVIEALCGAWQVTLIDPEWGRNDVLWPALERFAGT